MTSDMTQTFVDITTSSYVQNLAGTPFKMLIYNGIEILEHDFEILYFLGDVDLACGMMQAEYFIENFVNITNGVVSTFRFDVKTYLIIGHSKSKRVVLH